MNDNTPDNAPGGFTTGKFVALAVILTLGIIAGIKYMMSDSAGSAQPAASTQPLFKTEQESPPPIDNPARRPESMSSGGALDMFQKANEGYSKQEEAEGNAAEAGQSAAAKDTGAAATQKIARAKATATAATATAQKPAGGTVIPRMTTGGAAQMQAGGTAIPKMKPVTGFGAANAKKGLGGNSDLPQGAMGAMPQGAMPQGAGIPDIGGLVGKIQQGQGMGQKALAGQKPN